MSARRRRNPATVSQHQNKAPRRLGIKRMWSMSLAESIAFVLAVSLAVALLIDAT